jgi:hypothetical protein
MAAFSLPRFAAKAGRLASKPTTPAFYILLIADLLLSLPICRLFFLSPVRQVGRGCQIFRGAKYQNGEKYTKLPQNITNGHKIYQMSVK